MMKRLSVLAAAVAFSFTVLTTVVSAQYISPSYKVEETFFGAGGELESISPGYKAQSSVGALGIDRLTGTAYQAHSGFLTPGDPFLEMEVNTSVVDLGDLEATTTKTGTAAFRVRTYTNSGYVVVTMSQTPQKGGGASLDPMTVQGDSLVGTEQFGINLKANTSPATFGAEAAQQPDSSFANGRAATGYHLANKYKYNQGDIIADTNTNGWGLTIFTISYIANVSTITEAGRYSVVHDLVVVPTF